MRSNRKILIILLIINILELSACEKVVQNENAEWTVNIENIAENNNNLKSPEPTPTLENDEEPENFIRPYIDGEESCMEILKGITLGVQGEEYYLALLQYKISQPSHFVMHIDYTRPKDTYEYRNINIDNIVDQSGNVALKYMKQAYIADAVLDKYIRDFGGSDTLYHIRDVTVEMNRKIVPLEHAIVIYFLEIYNQEERLKVTWSPYIADPISVVIEGREDEEVRMEEYAILAQCASESEEYLFSPYKDDWYWMIINPEITQEKYYYRNVNPAKPMISSEEQICDELGYYIADQVIDKYIRDFDGDDVEYQVKLVGKEIKEEETRYVISVESDKHMLEVEYSDNSCFVRISIKE